MFTAIQQEFAAYIRDPEALSIPAQIEPRRMAIYKDLFFNNLEGTLSSAFPVLKSLYTEEAWLAMIRDFMKKHRCKTPLFYEVSREFLDYLEYERDKSHDPVFIDELAHYEWVELALTVADAVYQCEEIVEDSLLLTYKRTPLAWMLRYQYPVHQIEIDNQPESPSEQPHFFLIFRNEEDEVKFIELNLVSARLLDMLEDGLQARFAAEKIAEELQHPDPQQVIDAARQMIEDWRRKGILMKR